MWPSSLLALLILRGEMTIGQYTSFGAYMARFFEGYSAAVSWFVNLKSRSAQTQRYFELLDRKSTISASVLSAPSGIKVQAAGGASSCSSPPPHMSSAPHPPLHPLPSEDGATCLGVLGAHRRGEECHAQGGGGGGGRQAQAANRDAGGDDEGGLSHSGGGEGGEQLMVRGGEIELLDVFLAYPTRMHTQVLQGVSFAIKSGQRVALVGQSGAGMCFALPPPSV
jgi:ABC-type multidrug transport system fused ATPase/permease subunit